MSKILLRRLFLVIAVSISLYSCRTEEEAISSAAETANIQYGISEQDFLQSKFITGLNALKIGNAKNTGKTISPEDLAQRLDFEKAHLSSHEGEEIMHVPVRVFGTYKRSLLTISRNQSSNAYLLTYPNPEDHKLFYITNLNGELLKEVRIGEDGKEIVQQKTQNKSSVNSKFGEICTETVYVKCSSGQHSFASGNAYECEFWSDFKKGTPPSLFTVSMPCGDPGGGTGSGSGGPILPDPEGPKGGGVVPVGGGGPPKNGLTPSNCAAGIDCENCNIPGDTNGDCILSYDEAMAANGPCARIKAITSDKTFKDNITSLQGKTGETSERGYRMDYKNQTPTNPIGTGINNQYLQNKPGTDRIPYQYFLPSTYAIMHTHYDKLGDPMLSPADIIQFNEWLVAAKAWNANPANTIKIDLKNLSYTLVTSEGNYTLTFDGTDITSFPNFTQQQFDDLNNKYIRDVLEPATTITNVSNETYYDMDKMEEKFLKFVTTFLHMPGMKLFKIENSGNTEIFLKPNNNRDTKPCN